MVADGRKDTDGKEIKRKKGHKVQGYGVGAVGGRDIPRKGGQEGTALRCLLPVET